MKEEPLQCPNGCGETMESKKMDKPTLRPDGNYVLIRDLPVYRCSQCGEVTIPGSSLKKVKQIIETNQDPDKVSDLPEYHLKAS